VFLQDRQLDSILGTRLTIAFVDRNGPVEFAQAQMSPNTRPLRITFTIPPTSVRVLDLQACRRQDAGQRHRDRQPLDAEDQRTHRRHCL
jgi:hypothetical protein